LLIPGKHFVALLVPHYLSAAQGIPDNYLRIIEEYPHKKKEYQYITAVPGILPGIMLRFGLWR
jgi:hypothetical protein